MKDPRPVRTVLVGSHIVEFDAEDACLVRLVGEVSGEDVSRILDLFESLARGSGPAYLLIDLAGVGEMSREARQISGLRQLPPAYAGLVVFGGNYQQQLIAKFATTGGWLLRGRKLGKPRPVCVATEAEARAWLAEKRSKSSPNG